MPKLIFKKYNDKFKFTFKINDINGFSFVMQYKNECTKSRI